MRMQHTFSIVIAAAALVCAVAAQNMVSMRNGPGEMSATFRAGGFAGPVIAGAPYSAEQISEHTQTLSDGTHIVQPQRRHETMYRDSSGRTRVERPFLFMPGMSGNDSGVILIEIRDPVAGYSYTLDTVNKVAHRAKLLPAGAARASGFGGGGSGGWSRVRRRRGRLRSLIGVVPGPASGRCFGRAGRQHGAARDNIRISGLANNRGRRSRGAENDQDLAGRQSGQ